MLRKLQGLEFLHRTPNKTTEQTKNTLLRSLHALTLVTHSYDNALGICIAIIETGWNFTPVLKIVTHTAQAA